MHRMDSSRHGTWATIGEFVGGAGLTVLIADVFVANREISDWWINRWFLGGAAVMLVGIGIVLVVVIDMLIPRRTESAPDRSWGFTARHTKKKYGREEQWGNETNAEVDSLPPVVGKVSIPDPVVTATVEAPDPALKVEGGDGQDFDWTIPIMDTYRRLERANALESGAYVIEVAKIKVLRIANTSDFGIENVRVEATRDNGKIAANLEWFHNDSQTADIAPHSSQHVVVALWAKLGISLPGMAERQYERPLGLAGLPNGSVLRIKAWAPGLAAATAAFRVGTSGLTSLLRPLSLTPLEES